MREGLVLGSVTSTIKHPCLDGRKLLVVQILKADGQPDGIPEIVADFVGAGKGDKVVVSWDGIGAMDYFSIKDVPQRAWLCGIIDDSPERERS